MPIPLRFPSEARKSKEPARHARHGALAACYIREWVLEQLNVVVSVQRMSQVLQAIQESSGALRLLDRHVASLLAMTIPSERILV